MKVSLQSLLQVLEGHQPKITLHMSKTLNSKLDFKCYGIGIQLGCAYIRLTIASEKRLSLHLVAVCLMRILTFSRLIFSGITMMQRYPLTAAARAIPIPGKKKSYVKTVAHDEI
jgi:uncharacterized membrane protein